MKKTIVMVIACIVCFGVLAADAQPKKIALIGRISWPPGSDHNDRDRDFAVMHHFSMDDILLSKAYDRWGYFSIPMVDYTVQYMINNGEVPFPPGDDADYYDWVDTGSYMDYPTFLQDEGYSLAYVSNTCWSSIVPLLKDKPIAIIMAQSGNLGTKDKIGSLGMFTGGGGEDYSGHNTIQLTAEGQTHPLTAGLPNEIVVFGDGPEGPPEDPGHSWYGIRDNVADAAPGTTVLAVWADNPEYAAIAVVEEGGQLAEGTALGRMVMPFWSGRQRPFNGTEHPPKWGAVFEHLTPEGLAITQRTVQWALGETPTPVGKWKEW